MGGYLTSPSKSNTCYAYAQGYFPNSFLESRKGGFLEGSELGRLGKGVAVFDIDQTDFLLVPISTPLHSVLLLLPRLALSRFCPASFE